MDQTERKCPCGCGVGWDAMVDRMVTIAGYTREDAETWMRKAEERAADQAAAVARRRADQTRNDRFAGVSLDRLQPPVAWGSAEQERLNRITQSLMETQGLIPTPEPTSWLAPIQTPRGGVTYAYGFDPAGPVNP